MNDPVRLLGCGSADERALLESARWDGPRRGSRERLLLGMGFGVGIAAGTHSAAASAVAGGAEVAAGVSGTVTGAGASGVATAGGIAIVKWVGIGFAGGLLTAGATAAVRDVAAPRLTVRPPEAALVAPSSPAPAAEEQKPTEPPSGPSEGGPEQRRVARFPDASGSEKASARPDTPSLAEEVRSLDEARAALSAGRSDRALRILDQHARRFAEGALQDEAVVLRIETELERGNVVDARNRAQRFLTARPTSPHASRVRTLIGRRGRTRPPAEPAREGRSRGSVLGSNRAMPPLRSPPSVGALPPIR